MYKIGTLDRMLTKGDRKKFFYDYFTKIIDSCDEITDKEHGKLDKSEVDFYVFNCDETGKLNAFVESKDGDYLKLYVIDCDGLKLDRDVVMETTALCHSIDVIEGEQYLIAVSNHDDYKSSYTLKIKNYTTQHSYNNNVKSNNLNTDDRDYTIDEKNYKFWKLNTKTFEKNDCGTMVVELERYLYKFGYLDELESNGEFTRIIKIALIKFQQDYELKVTGECDYKTANLIKKIKFKKFNSRNSNFEIEDIKLTNNNFRPSGVKELSIEVKNRSDHSSNRNLKLIAIDENNNFLGSCKLDRIIKSNRAKHFHIFIQPLKKLDIEIDIKLVDSDFEDLEYDQKTINPGTSIINYNAICSTINDSLKKSTTVTCFENLISELEKIKTEKVPEEGSLKKSQPNDEWLHKSKEILDIIKTDFDNNIDIKNDSGIFGLTFSADAALILGVNATIGIYMDSEGNWVQIGEGNFVLKSNINIGIGIGIVYFPYLTNFDKLTGFSMEMGGSFGPITESVNKMQQDTLAIAFSIGIGLSALPGEFFIHAGFGFELDNSKDENILFGTVSKREWRDIRYHDIWHHSKW